MLCIQLNTRLIFSLLFKSPYDCTFKSPLFCDFPLFFLVHLCIDTVPYARMSEMRLPRPSQLYYRELTSSRILSCLFFGASNLHNQTACDCIKLLWFFDRRDLVCINPLNTVGSVITALTKEEVWIQIWEGQKVFRISYCFHQNSKSYSCRWLWSLYQCTKRGRTEEPKGSSLLTETLILLSCYQWGSIWDIVQAQGSVLAFCKSP